MQQSCVKFYLLCLLYLVSTKHLLQKLVKTGIEVVKDIKVILEQNGSDHSNSIEQYNGAVQQDSEAQVEKVVVEKILPIVKYVFNKVSVVIKQIEDAYRKLDIADDNIISEHTNDTVSTIEKPGEKSHVAITFLGSVSSVVILFITVVLWRRRIISFRRKQREELFEGGEGQQWLGATSNIIPIANLVTNETTNVNPIDNVVGLKSAPDTPYLGRNQFTDRLSESLPNESQQEQCENNDDDNQWADIKLPPGVRNIPITDLKQGDLLGSGGFAQVYEAKFYDNVKEKYHDICDKHFALKIIYKGSNLEKKQIKAILKEIDVMKDLDSQYVVKLIGAGLQDCPSIVMELVPNGSLKDLIYSDGYNSSKTSLRWKLNLMLNISKGIQYLHSKKIVHRDLKTLNILVVDKDQAMVKISDFGLSKIAKSTGSISQNGGSGTKAYMAPEACWGCQSIANKSDIWALGVIMQEIIRGVKPWEGNQEPEILYQLTQLKNPPDNGQLPETKYPQDLCALIRSCWCKPKDRPCADEVVKKLSAILQQSTSDTNVSKYYLQKNTSSKQKKDKQD